MQFSTSSALVLLASLASFVTADLHYKAICDVYNANATTAACAAYLAAPAGSNTWDSCPDCYMVTGGSPPYCNSDAKYMGGDQITSYCQAAGADNALTS